MSQTGVAERICPCRVTVLSRYNPDPLCAACARASCDSAGIVPTWLWDSASMRAALAQVDLAAFMATFRAASGLSQIELGNLVDGWSQPQVSLAERGLRDKRHPQAAGLRRHRRHAPGRRARPTDPRPSQCHTGG